MTGGIPGNSGNCMKPGEHCVYILECRDKTYYTGYTNNLDKRVKAHGLGTGAKVYAREGTVYCGLYHPL
ncbi:GIY-YIG nuclease family protein [Alteribacter lacisalsi]|uniref:GIY-YIG nuclease family protein n=1 Tax=Alteribacter lacisalsi TaxID=2045244 RepID=UPI002E266F61